MSVPFGKLEDHAVGVWFVCFVLCIWLGSVELISMGLLMVLYLGTALLTIIWKSFNRPGPAVFPGSLMLGVVVHGPLVVTTMLLLNMVPTSATSAADHRITVIGRYCIGARQPWCRPILNFENGAYDRWYRARVYNAFPPDGAEYVRFTTYRGLLGATVVWDRTFLNAERDPI